MYRYQRFALLPRMMMMRVIDSDDDDDSRALTTGYSASARWKYYLLSSAIYNSYIMCYTGMRGRFMLFNAGIHKVYFCANFRKFMQSHYFYWTE